MNTLIAAVGVWYALGSVGTAQYYSIPNEVNNARFCDTGFTCSADNDGSALQLGAGYRFDRERLGLRWSVEGAYVRTGTMKLNSQFPSDDNYHVPSATCLKACDQLHQFRGDWHMNGGSIAVLAAIPAGQFSVYGKLGALLYHVDGSAAIKPYGDNWLDVSQPGDDMARVQGWRGGFLYGLGVSYDKYRWKPFLEVSQTMTTGQGYPGFANWTQTNIGVRVDL
jgi:hypothetical protein